MSDLAKESKSLEGPDSALSGNGLLSCGRELARWWLICSVLEETGAELMPSKNHGI